MNLAYDNNDLKDALASKNKEALTPDIAIRSLGVSGWLSSVQQVVERLTENESSQSRIDALMRENQKEMDELLAKLAVVKEEHLNLKEQMNEKEEEYLILKIKLQIKLKDQAPFDPQSPDSIRPEDLVRIVNLRDKPEQAPQTPTAEPNKKKLKF